MAICRKDIVRINQNGVLASLGLIVEYLIRLNVLSGLKLSWLFHFMALKSWKRAIVQLVWKYVLSLRRCRQNGQTRRKTYRPGETRTHDHAFRGYLLYHWATSPYWTSRLSYHIVVLKVSSCLIRYCQTTSYPTRISIMKQLDTFFMKKKRACDTL